MSAIESITLCVALGFLIGGAILVSNYVKLRLDFDQLTKSHRALQDGLLSPNIRGNMGEKLAEDIIKSFGLVRTQHYLVQVDTDSGKPDFTFLLPNELRLNMDCKLQLTKYQRIQECEGKVEKEACRKDFLSDIKRSITSISKYIDVAGGTLDFALMFVANDQVFNFINMSDPAIYDFALERKVVLCSPWSLYAILRVVRIAVENFHLEKGAQELLGLFNEFEKKWDAFDGQIGKMAAELKQFQSAFKDMKDKKVDDLNGVLEKMMLFKHRGEIAPPK